MTTWRPSGRATTVGYQRGRVHRRRRRPLVGRPVVDAGDVEAGPGQLRAAGALLERGAADDDELAAGQAGLEGAEQRRRQGGVGGVGERTGVRIPALGAGQAVLAVPHEHVAGRADREVDRDEALQRAVGDLDARPVDHTRPAARSARVPRRPGPRPRSRPGRPRGRAREGSAVGRAPSCSPFLLRRTTAEPERRSRAGPAQADLSRFQHPGPWVVRGATARAAPTAGRGPPGPGRSPAGSADSVTAWLNWISTAPRCACSPCTPIPTTRPRRARRRWPATTPRASAPCWCAAPAARRGSSRTPPCASPGSPSTAWSPEQEKALLDGPAAPGAGSLGRGHRLRRGDHARLPGLRHARHTAATRTRPASTRPRSTRPSAGSWRPSAGPARR